MTQNGKSIIVCAPSGAGKTTIVRHLLNTFEHIAFSVSATSREPRKDEIPGVHYHFISADEFRKKIESSDFLEWEEVYTDQFYGTLKSEINRLWSEGKHVIFDVDVEGGANLKETFGDRALAIFVRPPSLGVLEERLRSRGTENEESLQKRLSKAERELSYESKFDTTVINDILTDACKEAEDKVKKFLAK
ncbi:MAG TPA: guanylate kinase [Cryomorphaceae bacterium]|nr:guanylate kinase [Cryomorphaceae bacterium]